MTYEESSALMTDPTFRGRVKVACLKYADSIIIEAVAVAGHVARTRWAQQCFSQPEVMAQQVQPPTVIDSAVQNAGAAIDDAALQAAVETVVNKII
jgi:hypothetical protein